MVIIRRRTIATSVLLWLKHCFSAESAAAAAVTARLMRRITTSL